MSQNEETKPPVKDKADESEKESSDSLALDEKKDSCTQVSPDSSPELDKKELLSKISKGDYQVIEMKNIRKKISPSSLPTIEEKDSPKASPALERKDSTPRSKIITSLTPKSPSQDQEEKKVRTRIITNPNLTPKISRVKSDDIPPKIPTSERPLSPEPKTEKLSDDKRSIKSSKIVDDSSDDWQTPESSPGTPARKLKFSRVEDSIKMSDSSSSGGSVNVTSVSVDENPIPLIDDPQTPTKTQPTTSKAIEKGESDDVFEYDENGQRYVNMYTYKVPITFPDCEKNREIKKRELIEPPKAISKSKLKERKTKNESKLVGFVKHVDSIDNRFHRLLRISGLTSSLKTFCGVFLTFFLCLLPGILKNIFSVVYRDSCPANSKILLWLLTFSLIVVFYGFFSLIEKYILTVCRIDFYLMGLFWTIYGTIILATFYFGGSKFSYDSASPIYCSKYILIWYLSTICASWFIVVSVFVFKSLNYIYHLSRTDFRLS